MSMVAVQSVEADIDTEMDAIILKAMQGRATQADAVRYEELRKQRSALLSPPAIARVAEARRVMGRFKMAG